MQIYCPLFHMFLYPHTDKSKAYNMYVKKALVSNWENCCETDLRYSFAKILMKQRFDNIAASGNDSLLRETRAYSQWHGQDLCATRAKLPPMTKLVDPFLSVLDYSVVVLNHGLGWVWLFYLRRCASNEFFIFCCHGDASYVIIQKKNF